MTFYHFSNMCIKNILIHVQQNTLSARNIKNSWLVISREYFLALRFERFWEHFLEEFLYFRLVVWITISKVIKRAFICIMNYHLQYVIDNLVKFNILIFVKGVPFLFQAGKKKRETGQLPWKKLTPLQT